MEKVPKIVEQRLKASVRLTSHPDADLMTAFSEGSLAQLERATVLEHLARCGECREIVALALPETVPAQTTLQPSRGWLAWPSLRWGFVTAGVLLVASFGVIQYRDKTRPSTVAYQTPLPTVREEQTAKLQTPAAKMAEPAAVPESRNEAARDIAAPAAAHSKKAVPAPVPASPAQSSDSAPTARGFIVSQQLPHGPRVNQLQNFQNNAQVANAPAPPPPAYAKQLPTRVMTIPQGPQPEKAEVAGVSGNANVTNGLALSIQSQRPDQQAMNGGQDEAKADGAPLSSAIVLGGTRSSGSTAAKTGLVAGIPRPSASWAINSSGGLQRSLDQGHSWQDVNVAENAPPAVFDRLDKISKEADKQSYDDKDRVARTKAANLVFRAVAANGADVWAGGSGGALYHSTDSGSNWTRVIPAASGATLTGEILSIVFSDPKTGVVTTSTPEVWSTTDGGQTWQKR